MTKDEALDLALEALEQIASAMPFPVGRKAITAIKQARALDKKAENARELGLDYEPVGEAYLCDKCQTPFDGAWECPNCGHRSATKESVYTTPPAAQPSVQEPGPACWQGEDGCPNRQACCDAQHCLYTTPPAAQQEPVAKYIGECSDGSLVQLYEDVKKGTDFYTTPPEQPAPVQPVAWVDWLPEGTTHIAKCRATMSSGGRLSLRTHAFKYEADVLKVYTTDNDNEYPGWIDAKDAFYHLNFAIVPLYTTPPEQPAPAPTSSVEIVTENLIREGVNKHKARGLAEHFYGSTPAAQPAPAQDQWLQAITEKIEAKLLSHRLSLHDEANDAGTGYPLVDALSCGQAEIEIGKQEVKAIAEVVFHVLAANTPPAAQRQWVGLTDEERKEIWNGCDPTHAGYVTALVEAKLKEKNI